MSLRERLFALLQHHQLLLPGTPLVVAVSGGTDSLALMHLFASLRERLGITLYVATLDHGLRGDAGADDVRFVVEMARAWGLEVTAGHLDVNALAQERRLSIEAAARLARYDFLASVARDQRALRVAVAHHAGDQVETILLHLLRGSGLGGLAGMSYSTPLPGHPDLTLIRPLLDVPRAELEAYCREQGLQPREDASNADLKITRNRLRHETLPYLRQFSPQVERHLFHLAETAALESDFADSALHAAIDPHLTLSERRISLPRPIFAGLHPALQRRLVIWAAHSLGASQDLSYFLITAAVELALNGETGARAQLKRGIQLRVDYETILVEHESEAVFHDVPLLPVDAVISVAVPSTVLINEDWALETSLTPLNGETT
ncbi:MAG: tRNA lysidine(34) synthetase TilS, partial [Chloroflexota bacterium]